MTDTQSQDLELAQKFAANNVPLEIISTTLDIPMSTLSRTLRRTVLTPEDEQLANGMRQLAWKAWSEAMNMLDNGHPDQKLSLLRTILSKTAGLLGQESVSTIEESKEAIGRIFSTMRDVEPAPLPKAIPAYAAPPAPPSGGADDSGQVAATDEDSLQPGEESYWR